MRRTQPNEFRHPVEIQRATPSPNERGGKTVVWSTFITTKAAVWSERAKEIRENLRTKSRTAVTIRMRYEAGVLPEMRVLHAGRTFTISGIANPEERNTYLDLICVETV